MTTFAVLGYVLWSEVRGDADVNLFHRRLPAAVLRQAIAVVLLAVGAITGISLVLLAASNVSIGEALFEATSAFGTVGLSTGITPSLPTIGLLALSLLMFVGRLGPVTMVTTLVLRGRRRLYTYPEERPIIG